VFGFYLQKIPWRQEERPVYKKNSATHLFTSTENRGIVYDDIASGMYVNRPSVRTDEFNDDLDSRRVVNQMNSQSRDSHINTAPFRFPTQTEQFGLCGELNFHPR